MYIHVSYIQYMYMCMYMYVHTMYTCVYTYTYIHVYMYNWRVGVSLDTGCVGRVGMPQKLFVRFMGLGVSWVFFFSFLSLC